MYIIDKYGYLTINEKDQMLQDLENDGFETAKIVLNYPTEPEPYGTLIELRIDYFVFQDSPTFDGGIKIEKRTIPLSIKKYSYSKI